MNRSEAKATLRWLNSNPPLQELMDRYPGEWEEAGGKLVAALENSGALTTDEAATKARSDLEIWTRRIEKSGQNPQVIANALPHLIKSRMLLQGLEKCYLAAASGKASGKIRFNLVNGLIIQRLLFRKGLERKPVSLGWFKFWWPLISQKRFLMPLVQSQGIYCFYSSRPDRGAGRPDQPSFLPGDRRRGRHAGLVADRGRCPGHGHRRLQLDARHSIPGPGGKTGRQGGPGKISTSSRSLFLAASGKPL